MSENSDLLQGPIAMNLSIPMVQIEHHGAIVAMNSAFKKLFPAELLHSQNLNHPLWSFTDTTGRLLVAEELPWTKAGLHHASVPDQKLGLHYQGQIRWYLIGLSKHEGDPEACIYASFWEITNDPDFKKPEKSVLEDASESGRMQNQRYKSLTEKAPFSIEVYNEEGILIDANQEWQKLWGLSRDQSIGSLHVYSSEHIITMGLQGHIAGAYEGKKGMISQLSYDDRFMRCIYYPIKNKYSAVVNVVLISEDITRKVLAEKVLKESEQSAKSLINALPEALALIDNQGLIHKTNKGWNQVGGVCALFESLFPGANFLDEIASFSGHKEAHYLLSGIRRVLAGEQSHFQLDINYPEGGTNWFVMRAVPIHYPLDGAVITFLDISSKKKVEHALETSLIKYRNIYNRTPIMLYSLNEQGAIVSVSDYWLEKMGYQRIEVIGKMFSDFVHPRYQKTICNCQGNEQCEEPGFVKDRNLQIITKEGEVIDVLHSCIGETDQEGRFVRSLNVLVDVSQQKNVEAQLHKSKEYVDEAQSIAGVGNFELDLTSGVFEASALLKEICGLVASQPMSFVNLVEIIHPDFKELVMKKLTKTLYEGSDFECEYEIWPDRTKGPQWVIGKGKVTFEPDGRIKYLRGTVQDITERKKNELRSLSMMERLELAATSSNIGVWEYSFKQKQFLFDEALCHLLGIESDSHMTLRKWMHLVEDPAKIIMETRAFLNTSQELIKMDYSMVTPAGEQKWIRAFGKLITNQDGQPLRIIGTMYDHSDDVLRQKMLEKVIEQKNMLLREVHHRVKNNMQMISSILALRAYEITTDADRKIIQECHQRIQSIARVYEHLYRMHDISQIDLEEYLQKIIDEHISHNYMNSVESHLKQPHICVCPDQALYCGLIVEELMTNAIKHNITQNRVVNTDIILDMKDSLVHLEVNNDGLPIPPDVLSSRHSGLGIDLIRTLVSDMRGELHLSSSNGFSITFPQEMIP